MQRGLVRPQQLQRLLFRFLDELADLLIDERLCFRAPLPRSKLRTEVAGPGGARVPGDLYEKAKELAS